MKHRSLAFALGLTLLAGCATLPPLFQPAPQALVVNGDATLRLSAEVTSGKLGLQALVMPYTAASIHHVTLTAYKLDGSTEIPLLNSQGNPLVVTISQAQLDADVTLSKLWLNTTYRIKAKAYADAAETQLISSGGASDQIDVAVTNSEAPSVARIKVTLIDRIFDGTATGGVSVKPGDLKAGASPAIALKVGVSTVAGSTAGSDDGPAATAKFNGPVGIAVDASGNVYVADSQNHRIRKITPSGVVSTLAGSTSGYADGTGTAAQFKQPCDLVVAPDGQIYVLEFENHKIRKVDPETGEVTTFAGSTAGSDNGPAATAKFHYPYGIAVDTSGNLFVGDSGNHRIRMIPKSSGSYYGQAMTAGNVYTLAGSTVGYADNTGTAARFNGPRGIAVDDSGNLYVADAYNWRIRKITPSGAVSTLAGSGTSGYADGTGTAAQFIGIWGMTFGPDDKLYVADTGNHRIRQVDPTTGEVTTVAGSSTSGTADGTLTAARFNTPADVSIDASGNLYVADWQNHRIRKIMP
jgi:streptogramin lyase